MSLAPEEVKDHIDQCVQGLLSVKHLGKGAVGKVVSSYVTPLAPLARYAGLDTRQISDLLRALLDGYYDTASSRRIINLLLPSGPIPPAIPQAILGSLTLPAARTTSTPLHALLLRWLILVYDCLEQPNDLQLMYGVIFHHLGFATWRPHLLHLLYLLTRPHHVLPFRIRILVKMAKKDPSDQGVLGLLSLYHSLVPSLIPSDASTLAPRRRGVFKCPDSEWLQVLNDIQKRWFSPSDPSNQIMNTPGHLLKKRRLDHLATSSIIPSPRTLWSLSSEAHEDGKRRSVGQMTGPKELGRHIMHLVPPDQMASCLSHPLVQYYWIITTLGSGKDSSSLRLNYWLEGALQHGVTLWAQGKPKVLEELTRTLVAFHQTTQSTYLLPAVTSWILSWVNVWNGDGIYPFLFQLIPLLPPSIPISTWSYSLFRPLERIALEKPMSWKVALLSAYTGLVRRWVRGGQGGKGGGPRAALVNLIDALRSLVEHVSGLSLLFLELERDHPEIQQTILSFYNQILQGNLTQGLPLVVIPSHNLIHRLLLSHPTACTVSRVCGLLEGYGRAFKFLESVDKTMSSSEGNPEDPLILRALAWFSILPPFQGYDRGQVDQLNSLVVEVCDALWRGKVLVGNGGDGSTFGLDGDFLDKLRLRCAERGQVITQSLGLVHGSLFQRHSLMCARELFPKLDPESRPLHLPITSHRLKEAHWNYNGKPVSYVDYRAALLDHLEDEGLLGIRTLLYAFMTSLIQRTRATGA
ncbi:MAG: Mis6-domain-containing protein [Piptocephalis tieghemiana]|nr:MAG: Mis6-domain-containing protein [Piptocephalis tieghemiana]